MHKYAWVPEWSNGPDLRSGGLAFVGSNPTSCKCSCSSVVRAMVL